MDRDDGFGSRCDEGFNFFRINAVGIGINIDQDGQGSTRTESTADAVAMKVNRARLPHHPGQFPMLPLRSRGQQCHWYRQYRILPLDRRQSALQIPGFAFQEFSTSIRLCSTSIKAFSSFSSYCGQVGKGRAFYRCPASKASFSDILPPEINS